MPRPAALLAVMAGHGAALAMLWPGQQPVLPAARQPVAVQLLPARPQAALAVTPWQATTPVLRAPDAMPIALPTFDVQAEPTVVAAAPAVPPASVAMAAPTVRSDVAEEPRLQSARRASCAPAAHPLALRERGIEGVVRLRVWVDELGRAGQVLLAASSGWRLFDDAAMAQARRCPFHPAQQGNQPIGSWVEFPVRFVLETSNG